MRLLAALSGGVDSAVAAALALEAGHEVVGVTLKKWSHPDEETFLSKGCCTLDAVADARRVCHVLGIPHYTLDVRETFRRLVVDPFVDDYARGVTPNPCVRCNELVRFGAFLRRALALGFEGVITGHYARVVDGRLHRARCRARDQSYVLYALDAHALARVHFPLGEVESKEEVRERARCLGLSNAERPDSVEVCFVGEGRRPGDVVAEERPGVVRPGPILDVSGRPLGRHRGLAYYTVGQRRGLGPLGPAPRYVLRLDPVRNAVVVGGADELAARRIEATRPRFAHGAPPHGALVEAVVRYHGEALPARYERRKGGFVLEFEEPARAPAPGQAVVLYKGDAVLGGGTIVRAA